MKVKFQNTNFNIFGKITFWSKQKWINKELIIWVWPVKQDSPFNAKMISFICIKISDQVKPREPAFIIAGQQDGRLWNSHNPGKQTHRTRKNVVLSLNIWKKTDMAAVNFSTFKCTNLSETKWFYSFALCHSLNVKLSNHKNSFLILFQFNDDD